MARKIGPCSVRIEDAAELMGIDAQTLRLSLQNGYYKDIGEAVKTTSKRECWNYTIGKFALFQRLGLDVRYSVEETIELCRQGNPPFIDQSPLKLDDLMEAIEKIKKDTSVPEKHEVSNVEPLY